MYLRPNSSRGKFYWEAVSLRRWCHWRRTFSHDEFISLSWRGYSNQWAQPLYSPSGFGSAISAASLLVGSGTGF